MNNRPTKFRPSKHAIDRYRERFGVTNCRSAEKRIRALARRVHRRMELPKVARDYANERAYVIDDVVLIVDLTEKVILTCYPKE